jgi:hypothetical protein
MFPANQQSLMHRRHNLTVAGLTLAVGLSLAPTRALAQNSPEELILTVARAQELASAAIGDASSPLGILLLQIGPSSSYSWGDQGLGHFSLALGGVGAAFSITSPDYTDSDPSGADRIDGPVGAFYSDLSIGLWEGHSGGRVRSVGSVDFLFRLGYTLGDQTDIVDNLDLGSLKPIVGAGLRVGLLKGDGLPSVSLAGGINFLQRRTFEVRGTAFGGAVSRPFVVSLNLKQKGAFLLTEVGKRFGFITPYAAGGIVSQRLEADYDSEVWYDVNSSSVGVHDDLEFEETRGVVFGGLGFGSGLLRFALEGGVAGSEPYGTFFINFTR